MLYAGLGRPVSVDDVTGTIRAFDELTQKYVVAVRRIASTLSDRMLWDPSHFRCGLTS